jgi:nucleoside-triphosphatase THEP1
MHQHQSEIQQFKAKMNLERTALQLEDLSIIDEIGNIEKTDCTRSS